ncbi:hypothetical protein ACM5ME_20605 [Bacillus subtilis]|uniref:hypothetical protein n=1 Tax=Bacillus subtilis TaxID=1423 RepID=UPI003AAEFBEB
MKFKRLVIMIVFVITLSSVTVFGEAKASEQQGITENSPQPTVLQDAKNDASVQAVSSYWDVKNHGKTKKVYSKWKTAVAAKKSNASGTLSFSDSYTSSNTYTGSLKASKGKVDATVGFNITKSYTQTAGMSVNVKKNKSYKILYRRVYQQYKVSQQRVDIENWTGKITRGKKYYVYPQKYSHIQFKAVEN